MSLGDITIVKKITHFAKIDLHPTIQALVFLGLFFFSKFYLFIHERDRERGRDTGRGRSRRSRLPMGT